MSFLNELDHIPIKLVSPEKIREEWSFGEVKKPETINYKTFKPEMGGLFCERIFGPSKDWHCASNCGHYKKEKYKDQVCPKCGVEVTRSRVRRERMGHIELAAPVAHYWFFKSQNNFIATILDIQNNRLEKIVYCQSHIVTDPGDTDLEYMQLLTSAEYEKARDKYLEEGYLEDVTLDPDSFETYELYKETKESYLNSGNYKEAEENVFIPIMRTFKAGIGAEVVLELLQSLDLPKLEKELKNQLKTEKSQQKRTKLEKRLRVVTAFIRSENKPEWMILKAMPVTPPELRPMVQLDGGRFATSDLNDLYRRIINRNNRLKRLKEMGAPSIIIENEMRMLQEAVDALIANSKKTHPVLGPGKRPLKSLEDSLKGKQGRFRQNLLGKRVDYSGRSVITAGPKLRIHQCGIPRKMALELFKPFVMFQMVKQKKAKNAKGAKRKIEAGHEDVWGILEQVVDRHPVLLNRAPTLHKLSIRAFEPIIVEGEAIMLHPLVCSGFNADFDGDQMAVHVPLSREAQAEAHVLMLASENLIHPQNGKSSSTPTQDMVLGCHYLSLEFEGSKGEGTFFADEDDAVMAYELGNVSLHARVILNVKNHSKIKGYKYLVTTIGKILFNRGMPKELVYINDSNINMPYPDGLFNVIEEAVEYVKAKQNKPFSKSFLGKIVDFAFDHIGNKKTAELLDAMMDLGFKYAMKGGLTISLYDVNTPDIKSEALQEADEKVKEVERLYAYGRITEDYRYSKVVEIWTKTSEHVAKVAYDQLMENPMNPIAMMIDSGARGSNSQYRQLAAMRGLMADPSGKTIERPIKANFTEGLSVFEYFISTHGARKGMADTSLKTADSGYLTRRMVDVAQDVVITEEDCGTDEFFYVEAIVPKVETLQERLNGRYLGETLVKDGEVIAEEGTLVNAGLADKIAENFTKVAIRSVVTCASKRGVCRKCYGMDLATRREVQVGEAVGVIAAQSIGEPGTQLTMRTFHTGGVAGEGDITQGLPRIQEIFEARKLDSPKAKKAVLSEVEGTVEIQEKGRLKDVLIHMPSGDIKVYHIPYGFGLLVKEGEEVGVGKVLTQGSVNPHELLKLKGIEEVQHYLLSEVQRVYKSQGVTISDKHIEVIVRQMTRKVVVRDPGDSTLVVGRLVDRFRVKRINQKLKEEGKREVVIIEKVQGITEASLSVDSFLSAASFEQTSKALSEAAVRGKKDKLRGLKESVIVGKRIPAGTGFYE